MEPVSDPVFHSLEERVLELWKKLDAFQESVRRNKDKPPFFFYDGPPFATGLPHYGHILCGTIKDTVTRFAHMTGHHVERRFGWDCVAEGSMVATGRGYSLPVDDPRVVDSSVLAYDTGCSGVVSSISDQWYDQQIRECVRVVLEDGRELFCTGDHKVMTDCGWMPASKLASSGSTRVIVSAEQPSFGRDFMDEDSSNTWLASGEGLVLRWNSYSERIKTAAFSSLAGLLMTDGTVFFRETTSNGTLCQVYLAHQIDTEELLTSIATVCGLRPQPRFDKSNGLYVVDLPVTLVNQITAICELSADKERSVRGDGLPSFVRDPSCPVGVVREFLAGMFGGDGHAPYVSRDKKTGRVSLKMPAFSRSGTDKNALKVYMTQLKQLLERVGVEDVSLHNARETTSSKTNSSKGLNQQRMFEMSLCVGWKSIEKFASAIGYRFCCLKSNRLSALVAVVRKVRSINNVNLAVLHRYVALLENGYTRSKAYTDAMAEVDDMARKLAGSALITFNKARHYESAPALYEGHNVVDVEEWLRQSGGWTFFVDDSEPTLPNSKRSSPVPSHVNEVICIDKEMLVEEPEEKVVLEMRKKIPCYAFRSDSYHLPTFSLGVAAVLPAGYRRVFDIRVPKFSSFLANGIVVHNCHGLPIEYEIDKKIGIKTPEDVLKLGIKQYNDECRGIVQRFSSEWETFFTRLGRWIDFKNDYKTMNLSFMESVWWVFSEIYKKGLVYKGFKVMPYSTACATPLSNFEASQEYREVEDPSVSVSFPIIGDKDGASLVAWTTTPWTLPSNLALTVNPTLKYVRVKNKTSGAVYVLLESRLSEIFKFTPGSAPDKLPFTILESFEGSKLVGLKYEPLFDYFAKAFEKTGFRVIADGYVTEESGTGVVHCAPAFGEDDYRVAMANGIIVKGGELPCPVDDSGRFTATVKDWKGVHVKEADKDIMKKLKSLNRVVQSGTIRHSYPHCWRSDTPLIYKAVSSWFVAVEKIKPQLLANNLATYWVPTFVQEKRFHNWLESARDWAVSRNRFWGTPLPIWISEDGEETVVVSSVEELAKLTGTRVTDLHRENVDSLTIPSKRGPSFGVLKRVPEVFDCWFESGSMPYASQHYPFENKEYFDKCFPADFIGEGIDQTRGWFYTLLVISTILSGKPPFKNLIVNGMVLAADGKKMSKRLQNYPDPSLLVNKYGADALRLYLINSPVVRADDLRFKEDGVFSLLKDVFLPWFNAYKFLQLHTAMYTTETSQQFVPTRGTKSALTNVMDRWISAATQSLVAFVRAEMDKYRLYTVVPRLVKFIDQLTNWYVRLNRRRFKGGENPQDMHRALSTLWDVLETMARAMAPFTPFLSETMYQNLKLLLPKKEQNDSVHFEPFPVARTDLFDPVIERQVLRMQRAIELGRTGREQRGVIVRMPLQSMTVICPDEEVLDDVVFLKSYILEELNVRELVVLVPEKASVSMKATLDFTKVGKRLGKESPSVSKQVASMSEAEIKEFRRLGSRDLFGHKVSYEEIKMTREFSGDLTRFVANFDYEMDVMVLLDLHTDETLNNAGLIREMVNRLQRTRKLAGLAVMTEALLFARSSNAALTSLFESNLSELSSGVDSTVLPCRVLPRHAVVYFSQAWTIGDSDFIVDVVRPCVFFDVSLMEAKFAESSRKKEDAEELMDYLGAVPFESLKKSWTEKPKQTLLLNGKSVHLELGKEVLLTAKVVPQIQASSTGATKPSSSSTDTASSSGSKDGEAGSSSNSKPKEKEGKESKEGKEAKEGKEGKEKKESSKKSNGKEKKEK